MSKLCKVFIQLSAICSLYILFVRAVNLQVPTAMIILFLMRRGSLLAGQRTCDSDVVGSSPGWAHGLVTLGKLCASVTKQYNLVSPSGDDLIGWQSNRGPAGGK